MESMGEHERGHLRRKHVWGVFSRVAPSYRSPQTTDSAHEYWAAY